MKAISIPLAFCLLVKRFARELKLTEAQIEILNGANLTADSRAPYADALLGGDGKTHEMLARAVERMVRPQLHRTLLTVVK